MGLGGYTKRAGLFRGCIYGNPALVIKQFNRFKTTALQHRETGSPACTDMGDLFSEAKLLNCCGAITTTDNTYRFTSGNRFCNSLGTAIKTLHRSH